MKLINLNDTIQPYVNRYPDGEVFVEIDDSGILHPVRRISIEPTGGCKHCEGQPPPNKL